MIPLSATTSEICLLCGMLIDPRVIPEVQAIVTGPEVFYVEAHADLYRLICSIEERTLDVWMSSVADRMVFYPSLVAAGGVPWLQAAMSSAPGAAGCERWAKDVMEAFRARTLDAACAETQHQIRTSGPDGLADALDGLETALMTIQDGGSSQTAEPLAQTLDRELERLLAGLGRENFVPTGYKALDEKLLGGLGGGDFVVIACRPSMGKTAGMACIAVNMARAGSPIGFLSMEMDRSSVSRRIISIVTGLSTADIANGNKKVQETRMLDELDGLGDKLIVDDQSGLSVMQVRALARQMVRRYKIECLFIDYLQLVISPARAESRQVEVSDISRKLKALARELNIPVVVAAQLNRGPEGRSDNRPRLSDLRESGSIEQDADVVILIHREEYYHVGDDRWANENPDKVGAAELIVAKQRNGPTGSVAFDWNADCARFEPFTKKPWTDDTPAPPEPPRRAIQQPIYAHSIPE